MRIFLLILVFSFFGYTAYSSAKTDSILEQLKIELSRRKMYDDQKELRIKKLKATLESTSKSNYNAQYDICGNLYEEYKVYQFDSAYVYTQKLLSISKITNNAAKQSDTKMKVAFLLLSSGMFTETFESLNEINTHLLNDSSRLEYYSLKERAYSDLAEYNSDKNYTPFDNAQSVKYLDSAIALSKP